MSGVGCFPLLRRFKAPNSSAARSLPCGSLQLEAWEWSFTDFRLLTLAATTVFLTRQRQLRDRRIAAVRPVHRQFIALQPEVTNFPHGFHKLVEVHGLDDVGVGAE